MEFKKFTVFSILLVMMSGSVHIVETNAPIIKAPTIKAQQLNNVDWHDAQTSTPKYEATIPEIRPPQPMMDELRHWFMGGMHLRAQFSNFYQRVNQRKMAALNRWQQSHPKFNQNGGEQNQAEGAKQEEMPRLRLN